MKYFEFCMLVLISSCSIADGYSVTAEYSFGVGIPIVDIGEKASTTIPVLKKIRSDAQCIEAMKSLPIQQFALGQALNAGATDVVLKCAKNWLNEQCLPMYPGCYGKAEFGGATHLHLYSESALVPDYLRLKASSHQIIQTIAYASEPKSVTGVQAAYVVQAVFNKEQFRAATGEGLSCEEAINSGLVEKSLREVKQADYLVAIGLKCFNISKLGGAKLVSEKLIRL